MKKKVLYLICFCALCFMAANFLAYMQAYKMIHYSSTGIRTEKPENLSLLQKVSVLLTGVNIPKSVNATTPRDWGLYFKTLVYPTEGGLNLSAWYVPHSKPKGIVILFHGHTASKSQVLPEAKAFYDHCFDLFLVDFRGSGDSDGNKTTLGYEEANDIKISVDYVRNHWPGEKIILYGNSMGSAAILHAFYKYSIPVYCVILSCPFDNLFHTVKNRFSIMKLPSFPLAHILAFWGSLQLGYNVFGFKPSEDAKSVHCPALLLYGSKDQNVLPVESESIFNNLGGIKVAEDFQNCGHESFLKRDPGQWGKAVFGFLNQCLKPG